MLRKRSALIAGMAVCMATLVMSRSVAVAQDEVRQVRVIYFDSRFNAWFEVDSVVPPAGASIGLSAVVTVPRVGAVRGWVVTIYRQPRMTSPYKTETVDAVKQNDAEGYSTGAAEVMKPMSFKVPGTDASKSPVAIDDNSSFPQRSQLSGHVRVWTNKLGTRQVPAELLEIRDSTILIRDNAGKIFEQSLANLSDGDVAFVREGSVPFPKLASANR